MNIPFGENFASRFISILFTDRHDHTGLYPQEAPMDPPNYDVQTMYF